MEWGKKGTVTRWERFTERVLAAEMPPCAELEERLITTADRLTAAAEFGRSKETESMDHERARKEATTYERPKGLSGRLLLQVFGQDLGEAITQDLLLSRHQGHGIDQNPTWCTPNGDGRFA